MTTSDDKLKLADAVVAAVEALLKRPEVKAASMMAPALKPEIDRLKKALADYRA